MTTTTAAAMPHFLFIEKRQKMRIFLNIPPWPRLRSVLRVVSFWRGRKKREKYANTRDREDTRCDGKALKITAPLESETLYRLSVLHERGKLEFPRKYFSEQSREQTNPTHIENFTNNCGNTRTKVITPTKQQSQLEKTAR